MKRLDIFLRLAALLVAICCTGRAVADVEVKCDMTFTPTNKTTVVSKTDGTGNIRLHALGAGTATVTVTAATGVADTLTITTIEVRLNGENKAIKLGESCSFALAEPGALAEYAPLFVVNTDKKPALATVGGNAALSLYPTPATPQPEGGFKTYTVPEEDQPNVSLSVGASSDWRYQWAIDGADVGAFTYSYCSVQAHTVEGIAKKKDTKRYSVTCRHYCPADNTVLWLSQKVDVADVIYLNKPAEPGNVVGYEFPLSDGEIQWLVTDIGLSDTQMASYGMKLIINGAEHARLWSSSKAPSTIATMYDYDGTPVSRTKTVSNPKIYTSTYTVDNTIQKDSPCTIQLTVDKKDGILNALTAQSTTAASIQTKDKTWHVFPGTVIASTCIVEFDCGTDKLTVQGASTTTASVPGDMRATFNLTHEVQVESNQTSTLVHTMPYVAAVCHDKPAIPTVTASATTVRDVDAAAKTITIDKCTGAAADGWRYQWSTTERTFEGIDSRTVTDNSVYDIPENEMATKDILYRLQLANTLEDGTVWFETEPTAVGYLRVYNTPRQPESIVAITTNDGKVQYAVKGVGLNDALLTERGYTFVFSDGSKSNSRYIATNGSMLKSVKTLWHYAADDISKSGYDCYSDATTTIDSYTCKFAAPTFEFTAHNDLDGAYKGGAGTQTHPYGLLGCDNLHVAAHVEGLDQDLVGHVTIKYCETEDGEFANAATLDGLDVQMPIEKTGFYRAGVTASVQYSVDEGQTWGPFEVGSEEYTMVAEVLPAVTVPVVTGAEVLQLRDQDECAVQVEATMPRGAVDNTWTVGWSRDDEQLSTSEVDYTVETLGYQDTHIFEVEGTAKRCDEHHYHVTFTNLAPDGTAWVDGKINAGTVYAYKTPVKPESFAVVKTPSKIACAAKGVNQKDSDLKRLEYKFEYQAETDGNDAEPRTWTTVGRYSYQDLDNAMTPVSVRSLWSYTELDGGPAFECFSDTVMAREDYDITVAPPSISLATTDKLGGIYKGHVVDKRNNHTLYGLAGCEKLSVGSTYAGSASQWGKGRTKVYREGEDNAVYNGDLSITMPLNIAGTYQATLHTLLTMPVDASQTWEQAVIDTIVYDYKVLILPSPVRPTAETDKKQCRDIDGSCTFSLMAGTGANEEGWAYAWTGTYSVRAYDKGLTGEASYPLDTRYEMNTNTYTYDANWTNAAPDGTVWISGTTPFSATVYNTPEKPVELVSKGNGTSTIYIVNKMSTLGLNDNVLASRHYRFQFGQGEQDGNGALTNEGCRWYKYGNKPSRPWVRSLWRYPDFDCYSDYTTTGSRAPEADAIEEVQQHESRITRIWRLSGTPVATTDLGALRPGWYIVERVQDGVVTRDKVMVK